MYGVTEMQTEGDIDRQSVDILQGSDVCLSMSTDHVREYEEHPVPNQHDTSTAMS